MANNGPLQYPRFLKSFSSSPYFFLRLLRFFGAQCFSQSLFLLSRLPGWFSQPPVSSPMGVTWLQIGAKANALSAGALHGQHLGFSQALTPSQVASATPYPPPVDPILAILPVTLSRLPPLCRPNPCGQPVKDARVQSTF